MGGKVLIEKLKRSLARTFLGERGFASRILFNEIEGGLDPLGPENLLIFAIGPLTEIPGLKQEGMLCTLSRL